MKKLLILTAFLSILIHFAQAQTEGVRTFSTACGQAENVSFVFGQPFYLQTTGSSGLEVAEGVCQAQIMYKDYVLEGCQNDTLLSPEYLADHYGFFRDYQGTIPFNGRDLHILPAGYYDSTDVDARHYSWTAQYNYDSVTTLVVNVHPIYEMWDTLRLYVDDMNGFDPGDNDRSLATQYGCDSLVHYFVLTCGEVVADGDGNEYNTLFVGPYCWTLQNMKSTHYANADGLQGDTVLNNRIYYSSEYPDIAANLEQYGRLYSWYSAMRVPEGSTEPVAYDTADFVRGICPIGYHIPTAANMESLADVGTSALKSTDLWIIPGNNSTGFTAYPAGLYNPNTGRFENLLGETRFWTSENVGGALATSAGATFSCNEIIFQNNSKDYGFSIRCVKN